MSKFRKKPVVIDAYCATTDSFFPAWLSDAIDGGSVHVEPSGPIYITTLEGTMRADFGDYIIRGVKGELYPCREDIFKATYEAVDAFAGDAGPSPDWRENVPWDALQMSVALAYMAPIPPPADDPRIKASIWLEQNAPKEAGE